MWHVSRCPFDKHAGNVAKRVRMRPRSRATCIPGSLGSRPSHTCLCGTLTCIIGFEYRHSSQPLNIQGSLVASCRNGPSPLYVTTIESSNYLPRENRLEDARWSGHSPMSNSNGQTRKACCPTIISPRPSDFRRQHRSAPVRSISKLSARVERNRVSPQCVMELG